MRRGDVAVVTGGSSGLGRRLAGDLAARGVTTIAIARREEELAALAEDLRRTAPDSGYVVCDVSDTDAYRAVLADVEERHGRVDLLVHAAGTESRVEAADAELEHYRDTFEVNTFAAIAGTVQVLPGMVARDRGYVVNFSSDQGRAPTPQTSAYSASKAALSAFTESVALERHGTGVHLHVVYPGWVPTPMGRSAVEAGMDLPPKPVRRTAAEVSQAVLAGLGGKVDINVAPLAALAPVARLLAPRLYARNLATR